MKNFTVWERIMVWLIALAMVAWGMRVWMPVIEGHFWPVVDPATLIASYPNPPPSYRYRWDAEADKLRDCDYSSETHKDGLQWFLGADRSQDLEVTAFFLDRPQERRKGHLTWTELIIALDPVEVRTNSRAYVWHQCPGWWRFWKTRSLYYQSPTDPVELAKRLKP